MTSFNEFNQNQLNQSKNSQNKKAIDPEVIRALTPIVIALIGGAIGITVLFSPTDVDKSAAFGVASTAIAGAAGLAQPNKDLNQKDE